MVTVSTSVTEMVDMVGAAYTRTQNTYNLQASNAEMQVVFNTFAAYFPTNNPASTSQDLLCIFLSHPTNICRQLTKCVDMLQTAQDVKNMGRTITVYCDESFLIKSRKNYIS